MKRNLTTRLFLGACLACASGACATTTTTTAHGAQDANAAADLVAAATSTSSVDFRMRQPEAGPAPELHAPEPILRTLDNGLTLLVVHKPGLPLQQVSVVVRSGSAADPDGLRGLASFTTEMLRMGTTSRNAQQIADEVETRGSALQINVGEDSISISAAALADNFGAVFDVLADVAQHPAFARDEIERLRSQRLAALAQARTNPQMTATRVFRRVLYGEHPYAHMVIGDEAALKKIEKNDLQAFFATHFYPGNAAVILVGALTAEQALQAAESRLATWRGGGSATPPPAPPMPQHPEVVLVARDEAPQSQLRIGHLGVARAHPDYFALLMCNAVLGGLFNSRINMNLREDKGYTYGARSHFDFLRGVGPFLVATDVRTDVTDAAVREIIKEIELIRAEGVTADELQNAKNRYALSLPGNFQTVDSIADMIERIFVFDLPVSYYQELPGNIAAVTLADVQRVAQAHLRADALSIIVVGDQARVQAGLASLGRGPVQLRDPEGNQL